jgi:hypothetical protein
VSDEAPDVFPVADEEGNVLPDLACPECAAEGIVHVSKNKGGLGSHRLRKHGIGGTWRGARKPTGKSSGPININVGARRATKGTKDAEKIAKTAAGATSMLNAVAVGLTFANQPEDAAVVAARAADFGKAIGDLSQYQPILATIFAPGDQLTGEIAAWLALAAVSGSILIPIASRHGWVPDRYAQAFGPVGEVSRDEPQPATA